MQPALEPPLHVAGGVVRGADALGARVEQRGGGAGHAAARVPVRGGRVDAAVGRAQLAAPPRPPARARRARQAERQSALLPGACVEHPDVAWPE